MEKSLAFDSAKRYKLALLALVTFLVAADAISGTGGAAFNPLYTFFEDLVLGFGGKAAAVAAVALGSIFSLARLNPVPILAGIAFAIFINFSPGIIGTIMTATV